MEIQTFDQIPSYSFAREQYLQGTSVVDIYFKEACGLYKQLLQQILIRIIPKIIITGENQIISDFISDRQLQVKIDGREQRVRISDLHYGEIKDRNLAKKCTHDHNRMEKISKFKNLAKIFNVNTWKEKGIKHPFKEIQKELFDKGYYLQDISKDVEFGIYGNFEGRNCEIVVGPNMIHCEEQPWHGLNVIPDSEMDIIKPFGH